MKKVITSGIIGSVAFVLAACGSTERVVTKTEFQVPQVFHPSPPPQVTPLDVDWIVVNREKLKELVKEAEQKGDKLPLLALTPTGYQNLSLTIQELKRYILQQREIILYYKRTYEDLQKNVEEANQSGSKNGDN